MILDAINRSLEFVLSGAVTTNQIPFVASYVDISQSTFAISAVSPQVGQSNDTTPVTIVSAPAASTSRQIKFLSISNNDTTAKTLTISFNDNTTLRRLLVVTLAVGDTVEYTDTGGWKVLDSSGNEKMVMSYPSMTSAQLAGILTDETGSADGGVAVFNNGPTLIAPVLGTPASGTLTNCTGLPAASVVAGTFGAGTYSFSGSILSTIGTVNAGTINGSMAVGGTWTAAATLTLPAHTLGGAITGGGQTVTGLGDTSIGTSTIPTGGPALTILDGLRQNITMTSTNSDATIKYGGVTVSHYTNSEEPMALIRGESDGTDNIISIGGPDGRQNAATRHSFYTAANLTTVGGTEKVRFTHTLNNLVNPLSIGRAVGTTPGANLDVLSSAADDVAAFDNSHATTPNGLLIDFSAGSPDNNTQYFLKCEDSITARCYIMSDGDLQNADNSYGAISDRKLKQDEVLADSQWDDIKAISKIVKKYRFKTDVESYGEDARYLLGLVAQDLEEISPGLVRNNPDIEKVRDDHGDIIYENLIVGIEDNGQFIYKRTLKKQITGATKSIKYSILYMKAIKALGEVMERIEKLEAKLN